MDDIQTKIDATATAPRVTPADLEAEIASEHYFTAGQGHLGAGNGNFGPPALGLLTFCVLVLGNGFTVVGQASCVSAENFDAEKGRKIARAKAIEKLWPLLGFRLADKLHAKAHAERVVASIDDMDD